MEKGELAGVFFFVPFRDAKKITRKQVFFSKKVLTAGR
jgi:hypothetical protein